MNASQAREISSQNNPTKARLAQAFKQVEQAALQGLRQTTLETIDPEVFQELQAQGYTLTTLQGRNETGATISW